MAEGNWFCGGGEPARGRATVMDGRTTATARSRQEGHRRVGGTDWSTATCVGQQRTPGEGQAERAVPGHSLHTGAACDSLDDDTGTRSSQQHRRAALGSSESHRYDRREAGRPDQVPADKEIEMRRDRDRGFPTTCKGLF
jgi:hypothetical protein